MIKGMKMKVSESMVNGQLHHLLKSTYNSESSFNYSFVNSIRPCCVWYEHMHTHTHTHVHSHRVMIIMAGTSPGQTCSVAVGAISDLITLGLEF